MIGGFTDNGLKVLDEVTLIEVMAVKSDIQIIRGPLILYHGPEVVQSHNAHQGLGTYPGAFDKFPEDGAPAVGTVQQKILQKPFDSLFDYCIVQQIHGIGFIGCGMYGIDKGRKKVDSFLGSLYCVHGLPQGEKLMLGQTDAQAWNGREVQSKIS